MELYRLADKLNHECLYRTAQYTLFEPTNGSATYALTLYIPVTCFPEESISHHELKKQIDITTEQIKKWSFAVLAILSDEDFEQAYKNANHEF